MFQIKANAFGALSLRESDPLEWFASVDWQLKGEVVCRIPDIRISVRRRGTNQKRRLGKGDGAINSFNSIGDGVREYPQTSAEDEQGGKESRNALHVRLMRKRN